MKKYFESIVVMAFACFLFLGIKEEPTPVHAESVAGVSAAVVPDVNVEIEFTEVTPVEAEEVVEEVAEETVVEEPVEEMPEETAEIPEEPILEVVPEEIPIEEVKPDYSVLNKRDGVNYFYGNKETYYNLSMKGVLRLLDEMGIEHGDYWVRDDGVKMLGDYIMLATDTRRWPKGTILETSLGTGMVVDHCSGSENYGGLWVDVAVTW